MSLFKIRTFWSTNSASEDEENYDQNSLIVSKLNSESDFIITGSHSGILRIFKPSTELTENDTLSEYKATDLLLEKSLNEPILQIGCGRLVSGTTKVQLAVLHKRLVSVYSLIVKEGATEHGTQNILQIHYEHKLRRSSYSFLIGPFGGTQNRDFICVQSLDGMLTFFEQESFSFCCFLPEFLLPSPIVFLKRTDCFVTLNSNWRIVCYKYKILSEIGENSKEDDQSGKKFTGNWDYNIGETIMDLDVVDGPNLKENCILILGETSLYCLGDNGKIKYMKRFDFLPICFTNYVLNDKIVSLVISETSTLLIYHYTTLKWSAQLHFLPISIKRAFLKNIHGVIVLLSEEGQLECCYLGTKPSVFIAPPLKNQDLDFESAGIELARLNKMIRNSYKNDIKITNASAERELVINVTSSPHLETCIYESNTKNALNNQMCSITIDILPQAPFDEVQLSIYVQRPLKVIPQIEFFNNLCERTSVKCHVFVDGTGEIPSLNLQVTATFISSLGIPRNISKCVMLPLKLVMETCTPQKENEHKITLNINQSPIGLSNIFDEFIGENSFTSASVGVGFKNVTETDKVVTVLLAKSSDRYRLQSNSFTSLNLLVEQIVYRLKKYFSNQSDFSASYSSSLPVNEAFVFINNHFTARQEYNLLHNELCQLSAQFRLIQKRLISKFKAKNPTPLTNLEILLEDTFSQIILVNEKLEPKNDNLIKSQIELSAALQLIVNLLKLMNIDSNLEAMLDSVFCSTIYDLEGQNWEDTMDAILCYLLRTVLAKSDKDKLRAAHTSFDEIKEITKVEKHFSQVLERIQKRGGLEMQFGNEEESPKEIIKQPLETELMPIGSQIGEASSRILSAKKGLLTKRHKFERTD